MSDETKFPEAYWDTFGTFPVSYEYEDINAWIQRCINEFPKSEKTYIFKGVEYPIPADGFAVQAWFTRWFTQFIIGDKIE